MAYLFFSSLFSDDRFCVLELATGVPVGDPEEDIIHRENEFVVWRIVAVWSRGQSFCVKERCMEYRKEKKRREDRTKKYAS